MNVLFIVDFVSFLCQKDARYKWRSPSHNFFFFLYKKMFMKLSELSPCSLAIGPSPSICRGCFPGEFFPYHSC